MEVGLVALGWTIAICVVVGLLLGYVVGYAQHRDKGKSAEEAVKAHEDYREEVHEHFQQTSQIMSRMVDDYREMYQHLSAGAGKLANIHPERVVTPPPAPEAITAQDDAETAATDAATEPAPTAPADAADKSEQPAADDGATDATPAASTTAAADDNASATPVDADDKARARRLSGNPV